MVEQLFCKQQVVSSNLSRGSRLSSCPTIYAPNKGVGATSRFAKFTTSHLHTRFSDMRLCEHQSPQAEFLTLLRPKRFESTIGAC